MDPSAEAVKQHETHRTLTGYSSSRHAHLPRLALDAIIVPASRPAEHLDHAVTLARTAGCWLLVLCSRRLRSTDARRFLAARSFSKAIVVDIPPGYRHELLSFPGLHSLRKELPEACAYFATDLSTKRNVGLILARMLHWQRVFFLDDDIRDIAPPDLQTTVDMLSSFDAVGMRVTDFPDNSIVCHANRMTGGSQDVFVSGAALAVNCDTEIGYFPDIYNEDWLFLFDDLVGERVGCSRVKATQLCYYPFANPRRAAWQEFGDVIAEGLYALLHLDRRLKEATREYWGTFLGARLVFLEKINRASQSAHPEMRSDIRDAVAEAAKCLLTIKPSLCERYVELWRQDLDDWKRRTSLIRPMPIEAALNKMGLDPAGSVNKAVGLPQRSTEIRPEPGPGPVTFPRFDTLKELSEYMGNLPVGPPIAEAPKRDTVPFPILTDDYSLAMLTVKANGSYSQWTMDEAGGRQRRQRLGTAVAARLPVPWRRWLRINEFSAQLTAPDTALTESEPEQETSGCR